MGTRRLFETSKPVLHPSSREARPSNPPKQRHQLGSKCLSLWGICSFKPPQSLSGPFLFTQIIFWNIQRQGYSLFTMEIIQLPVPQWHRILPYQLQSWQAPPRIILGTHLNSSANLEDNSFRHHPNLAYCNDSEATLWRGSHPHPGSQVCFIFILGMSLSLNPIFKIYIKMSLGAGKMTQSFQGTLHTLG